MVKSKYSKKVSLFDCNGTQKLTPGVPQGTVDHNSINHVTVNTNTMFQRKEVMPTNVHPPPLLTKFALDYTAPASLG